MQYQYMLCTSNDKVETTTCEDKLFCQICNKDVMGIGNLAKVKERSIIL